MGDEDKKYGDELFIYAMTLMEQEEKDKEIEPPDKEKQEVES